MIRQNLICLLGIIVFWPLTASGSDLPPPPFSTVAQANDYVRRISPEGANCSENKYQLAQCWLNRLRASFNAQARFEDDVLGVTVSLSNTSDYVMDGHRASLEAFDNLLSTSVRPFLSGLGLSEDQLQECTDRDVKDRSQRMELRFGDRRFRFSCSYRESREFGHVLAYILLTDVKAPPAR